MLEDFSGARFGDERLTKRLLRIVEGLTPDPSASFPDAAGTGAALEGTYRFFQNDAVSPEKILAPHAPTRRGCRPRRGGARYNRVLFLDTS